MSRVTRESADWKHYNIHEKEKCQNCSCYTINERTGVGQDGTYRNGTVTRTGENECHRNNIKVV